MSTQSRTFRRTTLGSLTATLLLVSSVQAAAASFVLPTFTLTPGEGYGSDARRNGQDGEDGGTRLGVHFTSTFTAQHFDLTNVGQSHSFDIAKVLFNEPDTGNGSNRGIKADNEQDLLDLAADFELMHPGVMARSLTAIVSTTVGALNDAAVDFAIDWTPLLVDFDNGGQYRISLNSLSFTNTGSEQTLRATVELLEAPGLRVSAVPEPGSFALVGVALAGAGFVRRKPLAAGQAAKKNPD